MSKPINVILNYTASHIRMNNIIGALLFIGLGSVIAWVNRDDLLLIATTTGVREKQD